MPDPDTSIRHSRWVRRVALALIGVVLLLGLLLATLPSLLSSDLFRQRLEREASRSLGRSVQVDTLELDWSGTFRLGGVRVEDDPAFAAEPLLTLGKLVIQLDSAGLLRRRMALSVRLTGFDLHLVRDQAGHTNLDSLLEQLSPPASTEAKEPEAIPELGRPAAEFTLPFREVDLTVRLDQLNLRIDDRAHGRKGSFRDFSLALDVHPPAYPIKAGLNGRLELDGKRLGPLRFDVTAERLLTPEGSLDPGAARLTAAGELPGGNLSARGGLRVEPATEGEPVAGLAATVTLDLEKLWGLAQPFLPTELAGAKVGGSVLLDLRASGDPSETVAFSVVLTANDLWAGGAALGDHRVGPADLVLAHRGRYAAPQGALEIEDGRISIQRGTHLAWRGRLVGLDSPAPEAELEVGPVTLDLAELHRLARPMLPGEVTLAWRSAEPPVLRMQRLSVTGPLAADDPAGVAVELRDLALEVPGVAVESGTSVVELRGLQLQLDEVSTRVRHGFPADLSLRGSLNLATADLPGTQALQLRDLSLSPLQLTARQLQPAVAGELPLAGHFELSQGLAVGRVNQVNQGLGTSIDGLHQDLTARGEISEQGALQLLVEEFGLRARVLAHDTGDAESPSVHLRPNTGEGDSPAVELSIADLFLSTPGGRELNTVKLHEATLRLGALDAAVGGRQITLGSAAFRAEELAIELEGGFPQDLDGRLSGAIKSIQLEGSTPVQVARLELPTVSVSARGLKPAAASLFGVAGTFRVEHTLNAEHIQAPGLATVEELHQELTVAGILDTEAEARLEVPVFAMTLSDTRVATPEGSLAIPLALRGTLESAHLTGITPETIDIQGLSLQLSAGPMLSLSVNADAGGLGTRSLHSEGSVQVDAGALGRILPAAYRGGGTFTGTAEAAWSLSGRLPSAAELEALQAPSLEAWAAPRPLPFLSALELRASLAGVGADLPLESGGRLTVGGVFTEPVLHVTVGPGGGSASFSAPLGVRWLEALPGLPPLQDPLGLRFSLRGGLGEDGTLDLRQALSVRPWGVEQETRLTLRGVRRLLARGLNTPPALWLALLGGEAETSLRVAGNPDLRAVTGETGVRVRGPLRASAGASLVRGEKAAVWFRFEANDATVALDDLLVLEGLDGILSLDKRVRLGLVRGESATGESRSFLSEEVLTGAGVPGSRSHQPPGAPSGAPDQGGGLQIARVRLGTLPVPVQLDELQLRVSLPGGLPAVDLLQAELLGGTVLSSAAFVPAGRGYALDGGLAFTGLSTERLVPDAAGGTPDEAEVSGQLGFRVPLEGDLRRLLSGLELQFRLTRVGPRTLGRALYALDPSESNQAILEQRRLVRLGRPLWAATEVRNGNLSLSGEVALLGSVLSLPTVDRVPVADLPGMLRLEPLADQTATFNRVLDIFAADRLEIRPDGEVRLYSNAGERAP